MLAYVLATLLLAQPQAPIPVATDQPQPAAPSPLATGGPAQDTTPRWGWKLNDAHRYRVERKDEQGTEVITYKLVVRGVEKIPQMHEQLGLPDVEYATIVVTAESLYFKAAHSQKPDCDTEHPDEADKYSIIGKLYATLKGHKARFITDNTGRVIATESNWPVEIAYAPTGDAGSVIDEVALGATFNAMGLRTRLAQITSTLAPMLKGTKASDDEVLEPLIADSRGFYVASKDIERSTKPNGEGKDPKTQVTGQGVLKMVNAPEGRRGEPLLRLTESSFEREVVFSPDGYVESSTGKLRRVLNGFEETLEFKVERLPRPTPEPPYVPKSKRGD